MLSRISRRDARTAAGVVAVARVALGASAVVLPHLPARPWIGEDAARPSAMIMSRALGGRDIALGLGTLLALRHDAPARGWLEAAGLADAADVMTTLVGWRATPPLGRWVVLAAAAAGVAAARMLSPRVD